MNEKLEKQLYKEELKIVDIEGAIFPTVEDEILNISPYTAYIPLNKLTDKKSILEKTPFKVRVNLSSPRELSEGEIALIKEKMENTLNSYEGEIEYKKRLRWKGLKWAASIESGFLAGIYYTNTAIFPEYLVGVIRFLGEFVFWGFLFFLPVTILPTIGYIRYLKLQKRIEAKQKNLIDVEFKVNVNDKMVEDIMKKYNEIDDVKIYEKLSTYAKEAKYELASKFYKKMSEISWKKESFVTRYIPASWRRGIKAWIDVRVEPPEEVFVPIGDYG
jgi:hypothetical protein